MKLTAREAAEKLGLSKIRVIQFCQQGRIPAEKENGRWKLFEEDVEEFAKMPRRTGNPDFFSYETNPSPHKKGVPLQDPKKKGCV